MNIRHQTFQILITGLASILLICLAPTIASSGGEGHVHVKGSTEKLEIPEKYHGKVNPYWTDLDALVAGSKIYSEHCAGCHGTSGKGDGPLADSMKKKPFSFEDSQHMSQMNGSYLYWRTMEGGDFAPFKSQMPAFKDILTEEQVWQVLSYAHAFSHRHLLKHEVGEVLTVTPENKDHKEPAHKKHSH